ncbi:TA system VapC family ribonuclease toxin [Sandaracinobacteroides saxicola]|uniref:VapC toxin family PIN domain ribonuclease n=1 Tax=Sandaracinobacteroides saxicola TaxID=2759707 RepID=A0A7G5IHS8_9SPHN|nr:TA system VapC family ribonuclease toxin [Sandaracinobacteroides saxicola]QMW22920.1 VapC toxin family PIN domain ribonuclease [Sandaracinobacteroides saxicola]
MIALFDTGHMFHDPAHQWLGHHAVKGWATCSVTEMGFARIMGNPNTVGGAGNVDRARRLLAQFKGSPNHMFWGDDVSFLASADVDFSGAASRHVTDIYLLLMAVRNRGTLVTFDRRIPAHVVPGGREALVVVAADA